MMNIDDNIEYNNEDNDGMPALVPVHPAWIQDIQEDLNNINNIPHFGNFHLNPLEIPNPFPGHILNLELDLSTLEAAFMANGINNDVQDWVRTGLRWIIKTTTEAALQENPIEPHIYNNGMNHIHAVVNGVPSGNLCDAALEGMAWGIYNYVEWLEHSTVAEISATVADLAECLLNVVIEV
jgi:hypothetical protein